MMVSSFFFCLQLLSLMPETCCWCQNDFIFWQRCYNEIKEQGKQEVLLMLRFAIEYLIKEKKKSTNLLLTATCSLLAMELILEMYCVKLNCLLSE